MGLVSSATRRSPAPILPMKPLELGHWPYPGKGLEKLMLKLRREELNILENVHGPNVFFNVFSLATYA